MPKALFFSLPSVSVTNTLTPVVEKFAASGYEIVYYNTQAFQPKGDFSFRFKAYPPYKGGYNPTEMEISSSYFQFGEVLIETAESLLDFLLEEVKREKPVFIIHSHLALWGQLVARHFKLPSLTLFTTFILDQRIMLPEIRKSNSGQQVNFSNINQGKMFYQKIQSLYSRLNLRDNINIWDIYVNKGNLNLSFIMEEFQPTKEILGPEFKFVGFPIDIDTEAVSHELIYIAFGTIFNKEADFYSICLNVLKEINMESILSIGKGTKKELLGELPPAIKIEHFVDQISILKKAALFLTRGGMASVQEAVYTLTPMIVIPDIPEQRITANKIEELGIGIQLPKAMLTEEILRSAIHKILSDKEFYINNLKALVANKPVLPAPSLAFHYLDSEFYAGLPANHSFVR